MENFKKVISPIWYKPSWKNRFMLVFCEIEYKDGELSISGNALGSCGQIDMGLRHRSRDDVKESEGITTVTALKDTRYNPLSTYERKFTAGWNEAMWESFLHIWDTYHLNGMKAGCEHQDNLGWKYDTHKGQKCPVCEYQIGTSWIKREVPEYVLEFLKSLPDPIRTPNWV